MAKVVINKTNGLFSLEQLYNWFKARTDGDYLVEVRKVRRTRSLNQNAYLWGCVYPLLLEGLNEQGWEFTSVEQVHEFFKTQYAQEQVINKHTGEVVTFPSSTREMDTVTFSSYCDKLREVAQSFLGINIPDPNEL